MKSPLDLARKYLALADRDIKTFLKLVDDSQIDDEPIGFHAQQSVEKCLKAILAYHKVEFRRTHDLKSLFEAFQTRNITLPPFSKDLLALNPFAVLFRYEFLDTEPIDRQHTRHLVLSLRKWVENQIPKIL